MTNPTDPYEQPQPDRPQWEQPQWEQPQWEQPQWEQPQREQPQAAQPAQPLPTAQPVQPPMPQYGQPQYGQPQYGAPQYPQPHYPQPPFEPLSEPAPARAGRTRALIAASVTLVVIAGAAVSFVALRDKNSGAGSSTPQGAVTAVVADLTKSDILGILDDLPPAERAALGDSLTNEVTQLKRLKVLNPSADPGRVAGVHVTTSGLTFDKNEEVINDHVRIVKVTGGTITLSSDAAAIPYTKEFLDAAFPDGAPTGTTSDTVDIAKEVKESGGPARIAVQKVGGKWYPSLMYTIVDAANQDAGNANPTAADAIPAVGFTSPTAAVKALVDAAVSGDAAQAIAVLDPNDSAALHDYGTLLTKDSDPGVDGVTLDDLQFTTTAITGGTRVSLKSFTATDDGTTSTVTVEGDCLSVREDGDTHRFCAADAIDAIGAFSGDLSASEKAALDHVFAALPKIGVVTTEVSGKWYVSPIRSYADLGTAILSGLGSDDLLVLIKLARREH